MRIRIVLSLICISILLAGTACSKNNNVSTEEKLAHVKVVAVKNETIEKMETYNGQLKASKEVTVSNKYSGEVEKIYFDVGDRVKKGDILYSLKSTTARNSLSQLEAQLSSAQAAVNIAATSLEMAKGSSREDSLNQMLNALSTAKTGFAQAEIQYKDIQLNYERSKQLYGTGAVSKQQFEQAENAYKAAESSYMQAKTSLDTTQKTYDLLITHKLNQSEKMAQDQLAQAEAAVNTLSAQYRNAVEMLEDFTVRSPIDGFVALRNIEVGENIGPVAAFTVVDTDTMRMEINIPEKNIQKISLNQKAEVAIGSLKEKTFEGSIISICPAASAGVLTYPVRIEMPNKDGVLRDGLYGEASLVVEKREGGLVIPRNCIFSDGEKKYVYVVENGVASLSEVKPGLDNGSSIEVISGLKQGQMVIEKGMDYITNGQKVVAVE